MPSSRRNKDEISLNIHQRQLANTVALLNQSGVAPNARAMRLQWDIHSIIETISTLLSGKLWGQNANARHMPERNQPEKQLILKAWQDLLQQNGMPFFCHSRRDLAILVELCNSDC